MTIRVPSRAVSVIDDAKLKAQGFNSHPPRGGRPCGDEIRELIIEDVYGEHAVKLAAGDMILYPATSLHRLAPITRGARWGAVFWAQSMVKSDARRTLLHTLDRNVQRLGAKLGQNDPEVVSLTGAYHNLLRMWAEV